MAQANEAVAALLGEYAELVAITGGDMFRARIYEKAERAIQATLLTSRGWTG